MNDEVNTRRYDRLANEILSKGVGKGNIWNYNKIIKQPC